ncbi:MAG: MotA/TolQ/ExbB proton channel family protein [Fibrobacteraceae bacterium]|nr:MotA/TolQ/ExbB proton channel family protein [Fibrobacteraceae bacterium]
MNRFILVCSSSILAMGLLCPASAKKQDPEAIQDSLAKVKLEKLQSEVDALEALRFEKADALEKKEAAHWSARYKENKLSEDHDQQGKDLDSRYSKLSTDIGRLSEELTNAKSSTVDFKEKAEAADAAYQAMNLEVSQAIEKQESNLSGDYPVGMENRMLSLSQAKAEGNRKNPNTIAAMRKYFDDALLRHRYTYTEEVTHKTSQVGNRAEVPVTRLRLGTVFLVDAAENDSSLQALLRTGSLQGKIFEWSSELPPELAKSMRKSVFLANSGKSEIEIPLDILQNKAVRNATDSKKNASEATSFKKWFLSGGIVMYPLAFVALFAILLCLERFITLALRGRSGNRFLKKFYAAVDIKDFDKAMDLCLSEHTSISSILLSIVRNANKNEESAERALKEAMLREQPKLEKRMGLVAALGTIAPLLGLLGTVTGIITLFTVITQVGTNDARILAGGISEALVTTEAGLIIAIPVMVIHGFLSEKIEKVMNSLYVQSTVSLNKIFPETHG